jgi:hypothetical protein
MSDESPISKPPVSIGRVLAGLTLAACWVLAHVVLFYLIFVSSFLLELLVSIVRPILFPGESSRAMELSEEGPWAGLMTTALWLSGAAGVALGLRVFWRAHAKLLMRSFALLLLAGFAFGFAALVSLVKSGL